MDADLVHIQEQPTRETIRDARGTIVGVIERQRLTGNLVARDRHGTIVGAYEERSRTTRDAYGKVVGRTNLLPTLLFQGR